MVLDEIEKGMLSVPLGEAFQKYTACVGLAHIIAKFQELEKWMTHLKTS